MFGVCYFYIPSSFTALHAYFTHIPHPYTLTISQLFFVYTRNYLEIIYMAKQRLPGVSS